MTERRIIIVPKMNANENFSIFFKIASGDKTTIIISPHTNGDISYPKTYSANEVRDS